MSLPEDRRRTFWVLRLRYLPLPDEPVWRMRTSEAKRQKELEKEKAPEDNFSAVLVRSTEIAQGSLKRRAWVGWAYLGVR